MTENAADGDRVAMMHLFGIRHAERLKDYKVKELFLLCEDAGLSSRYGTELRKMVRLSKYVEEKQ